MEEHYKQILKSLELFKFKKNLLTVFKDCIHVLALDYAVRTDSYRRKERFADLEKTRKQYADHEKDFTAMQIAITDLLKVSNTKYGDHLGHIYMQLVPKSANKIGQVFTPYHIAKLMSLMVFDKGEFDKKDVVSYNDPACDAGVFMIATCDVLNNAGINYTQKAVLIANDIDITCVEMCYLQLSFLGASAVIEHKDTLTQKKWDEFRTIGYLLTKRNLS